MIEFLHNFIDSFNKNTPIINLSDKLIILPSL